MTGKYLLRAALLLAAFSCVMSAATVIDLKFLPYQRVGDAWGIGTYLGNGVDHYGPTDITSPTAPSMTLIGGNINNGNPLAITDSAWSTLLGFSPSAFDPFNLNPPGGPALDDNVVVNGSAIAYTINAATGDSISTYWDFVANDDTPYDDFAFFAVYDRTASNLNLLQVLARIDTLKSDCLGSVICVGLNGESGWQQLNYAFLADHNYTVSFGSLNVSTLIDDGFGGLIPDSIGSDPGFDSALLVDAVPEPSTFLLAGSALIAAALLRRRKTAK